MTLQNSGNLLLGAGNNPSENWWKLYIAGSVSGSIYVASGISYFGGNVGIGTTSPVYRLHVVNSGNTLLQLNGNNTTGLLDTGFTISADDSKNVYLYQRENAATIFGTNNTERMRITSGGNVGIGTTSPASTLHVAGPGRFLSTSTTAQSANVGLYLSIGSSSLNYNGILFQGVSVTDMYFGRVAGASVDDLAIIGASELVRFKANGNVGIGLTSPSTKLDISGSIRSEIASDGNFIILQSTGQRVHYIKRSGQILQFTSDGANTYDVQFDSSNRSVYFATGSVGIGTTSPTLGTLQVNGNVYATSFTGSLFGTASFAVSASYTLNATSASFATNASTASFISAIKDGMAAYFQPATNDGYNFIKFDSKVNGGSDMGFILFQDDSEQTSGSLSGEDVRFTMGVFNDFSGTIHSDELWMQGGARLVYNVGSWDSEMNSIIGTPSAKSAGDLYSWNKNNSPVMTMNIDGNLGIGTSTAGALLAVNGDAFFASKITIKGSAAGSLGNSSGLQLYQDSGTDTSYLYNYYNGPLLLGTNNTERLRITSGGNVGIGTTSPQTKLDINGVFGVGSKSFTCTNSYTTGLTINLNAHTGVYIKVTMHADLSGYSAVGYMGEYFVQNGSGGYSEPGIIIREVNNTDNGSVVFSANIVDPAGSGARNFELQFKQNSGTASVGTTLIYQIQGTYNSIS